MNYEGKAVSNWLWAFQSSQPKADAGAAQRI